MNSDYGWGETNVEIAMSGDFVSQSKHGGRSDEASPAAGRRREHHDEACRPGHLSKHDETVIAFNCDTSEAREASNLNGLDWMTLILAVRSVSAPGATAKRIGQ